MPQTLNDYSKRSIFNKSIDSIIIINNHGIITQFNNSAEKLFGYTFIEVIDKNVSILMPSPHTLKHNGYICTYFKTGISKMIGCGRQQLIGLKKDKSEIHIDLEVVDFMIDNQIFFRGTIRDITSIKQIELDLLNSEAKARAILDTTIDSIISINTCGLIELFNPAAERLFEYNLNEVIGKNVKMLMSHTHSNNHDEYIEITQNGNGFSTSPKPINIDPRKIENALLKNFLIIFRILC